jgi:hypothetical protein
MKTDGEHLPQNEVAPLIARHRLPGCAAASLAHLVAVVLQGFQNSRASERYGAK